MKNAIVFVFTLLAVLFITSSVNAQVHKTLEPHLIGLQGWEADAPEGLTAEMSGITVINAMRRYYNDDSELSAVIMIGSQEMVNQETEITWEKAEGGIVSHDIDGFRVTAGHDRDEQRGIIYTVLARTEQQVAVFILNYEDLGPQVALALARKFDWKAISAAVKKLM